MRFVNKRLWVVVPVLCALAVAVVAVAAYRPAEEATWKQSDLALGQPAMYQDAIEDVSLMLKADGFAPAEVRTHGKKFLLSLDNRTDLQQLTLRMARSDGLRIREIRVPGGGGGDWSELFELQPGTYTFSEVDHPNWICTIVITE
jgi:hypothetical protein